MCTTKWLKISLLGIFIGCPAFAEDSLYTQDIDNGCTTDILGVDSGNSNKEFVAQYEANVFNVAYDSGTGTGTKSTTQCTYDDVCVTPDYDGFSKTGYDFSSWDLSCGALASDCTEMSDLAVGDSIKNATSTHEATVTLTANWTPHTYEIIYSCGAGVGTSTTENPVYDSSYIYNDGAICTKIGYTISGWSCADSNETVERGLGESMATWNIDSDVSCVAQWTPNTINIDFVPENGGQTIHSSCEYDGNITMPNAPAKTGYRFIGWKLQNNSVRCSDITDKDVCNVSIQDGKTCYWAMNIYTSNYECKVHN